MTIRAYKLCFSPTGTQERTLAKWFGYTRWIWNWALHAKHTAWARRRKLLNSAELSRVLTRIKRSKSRCWFAEAPLSAHTQKLRDLDTAYRNAFAGRARYPRFKSRCGAQRARVRFDQRHAGKVRAWLDGRKVLLGLGAVKLGGRPLPPTMPKLVTVSRDTAGRYWASFAVEGAIAPAPSAAWPSIGIDLGIAHWATLSTGEALEKELISLTRQAQ